MKILSKGTEPVGIFVHAHRPTSAPPTESFAGLLDNGAMVVGPQRGRAGEAAGLGAFGIFGRYGAVAEKRPAQSHGRKMEIHSGPMPDSALLQTPQFGGVAGETPIFETEPQGHDEKVIAPTLGKPGTDTAEEFIDARLASFESTYIANPVGALTQSDIALSENERSPAQVGLVDSGFDAEGTPAQIAPVQGLRLEDAEGRSSISVTVAGLDSALTIGVSGLAISDGASLRDIFENTAAEFGMKVARFRLSGSALGGVMGGRDANIRR